jgi:hypothetical protein
MEDAVLYLFWELPTAMTKPRAAEAESDLNSFSYSVNTTLRLTSEPMLMVGKTGLNFYALSSPVRRGDMGLTFSLLSLF